MLRRAFMVSAASGSTQGRQRTAAAGGNNGGDRLQPRDDIDLPRQRAMVDAELRDSRERWLAAQVSPAGQSLEYRRHALRLLVINAAQHQQQHRSPESREHDAPIQAGSSVASGREANADNALPPFDLTRGDNLKSLLSDIDLVIRMAAERNAQMQQRMLSSTIDQIAKLDLWVV